MLDVQIGLLAVAAARLFALGEETGRSGTEHPGRVPSAAFQCRDGGWMHISGSDQDWPNLCRVLGLDELAADPALARNLGRVAARERVMAALRTAIAARDRAEVAEALRAVGVPAGEVNGLKEILEDPHIAARGVVGHFDHPNAGRFPALGNPLKFEGWDDPGIAPPPVLGADTRAVLAEIAGLGEDEIDRLTEEKAT
jgi:crotonobetainyl-CoA:carnitine CoA-transferase CaiB-like acyl-CoA transferase